MSILSLAALILCALNVLIYSLIVPHGGAVAWFFAFAGAWVIYRGRRQ